MSPKRFFEVFKYISFSFIGIVTFFFRFHSVKQAMREGELWTTVETVEKFV